MKAIYNNIILAESNSTIKIEQDYYFPVESINMQLLKKNGVNASCTIEGDSCYYDVDIDGKLLKDAASSFSRPLEASSLLKDFIVFGKGIEVIE